MPDYQDATAETIDHAVAWAAESTRNWFDIYVRMVDAAASGTVTADSATLDVSTLVAAGARDVARAASTWTALGNALLNLNIPSGPGGAPGGGDGDGPGDAPGAPGAPGGAPGGSGGTPGGSGGASGSGNDGNG